MEDWLLTAGADAALMDDFNAICAFGGRLSGSGQDTAAIAWALARMRKTGGTVRKAQVPYDGWRAGSAELQLLGPEPRALACRALLRSAPTPAGGLVGEVLDLGQGRVEDFERAGDAVRGKIVLVRHEYPFSPTHLHRRRKYDQAVARGAAGFLIANPLPGRGVLSGSSGRPRGAAGIPAAYIDFEGSQALAAAAAAGRCEVRLLLTGEEQENALADLAILDIPGGSDARVVISAHMDGHDLGTSALDNATGVAVALAAARALAPRVSARTHGLRVCLFTAEEWALAGSARYLDDMDPAERATLKLNINLDTVAGDSALTAMISEYPALAPFVAAAAADADTSVGTYLPFMSNSDHANFARHGIPALRLTAGFDRPESNVNNILAAGDVAGVVDEADLRNALRVTCAMAWRGLTLPRAELDALAVGGKWGRAA
ncbi:M28 family peptidase [Bordetella genomosp. 10]|nr:M28 family peptidase [Bordetella genomosp. 10]